MRSAPSVPILKSRGLWAPIGERIKALRQRHDIGRALSREDELKLLEAIRRSDSPALLPLFLLAMDTGLRASESRELRGSDSELSWKDGAIVSGRLVVPKSKTEAGTGRLIPLTRRVCATLSEWVSRLPQAKPESYVFPHHRIACRGRLAEYHLYEVDFNRPIGSWKRAWKYACRRACVAFRWHDLRHTFVSRLAENPAVSEETIRSLAGHVSKQMLQRYSHIRIHAKETAILGLEGHQVEALDPEDAGGWAQKWAQLMTERLN